MNESGATKAEDKTNGADKPQTAAPQYPIAREIDRFVSQIDALSETLPLASTALQAAADAARLQLEGFLKQHGEVTERDGKRTFDLEGTTAVQLLRVVGKTRRAVAAIQIVPRSLLVSLVSQFDAFLGGLIRELFKMKPEILNASANTLTFSQLMGFGSLENAREYIVDKEVESVLRKSHTEQFDWLENKFGLPLRQDLKIWPTFIEVTERRNLFVHTNGVASHQYIEVCNKNGCTVDADLRVGKTFEVSPQYFLSAHDCFFEIGVKLAHVLWRKVKPDQLEVADLKLNSVCYELLVEGRYQLARVLLDFAVDTLKKHSSEAVRLAVVVNRAQAYKWLNDQDMANKILAAEDWTATDPKFRLARAVLIDDLKAALEMIRQIGKNGEVNLHAYRDWPLFREARKNEEFTRTIEEVFGEPLNRVELDASEAGGSKLLVN